jgi:hypothetical protein
MDLEVVDSDDEPTKLRDKSQRNRCRTLEVVQSFSHGSISAFDWQV